jgi:hypothetical protein
MKDPADLQPGLDQTFPSEAWEDQIGYKAEMQQVEPATSDMSPGTASQPAAGKFATGLVLQQKATDSVTGDELAQIAQYQQDLLELRLWMTQQSMTEDEKIEQGRFPKVDAMFKQGVGWPTQQPEVQGGNNGAGQGASGGDTGQVGDTGGGASAPGPQDSLDAQTPQTDERTQAYSLRGDDGGAATLIIGPLDIQEDFEIIPEIGSTLAQDDQFKQASIQTFFQVAAANQDVFNKRAAAEKLAMTIPGITAEDALMPPQPPKGPDIKISVSIQAKFEDLPVDVKQAVLSGAGLPTAGAGAEHVLQMPGKLADAADAVDRLKGVPSEHQPQPPPEAAKPSPKPNGKAAVQ